MIKDSFYFLYPAIPIRDCWANQITEQQTVPGAWKGSSFLSTGSQTDGKSGSFVVLTYEIKLY